MKIYFTASLRGKNDFGDYYSRIVKYLASFGYNVFADHILKADFEDVEKQDKEQVKKIYQKLVSEIKKADYFVAEASSQSMSVGHEITQAINLNKPVIVLYTGDHRPSLLFGSGYEKLLIAKYDKDNLKKILFESIENAKKHTDVRFNFFVSPKILAYLDWIAKKRMVPRSVFLRDLIEKEIKKDKEFKG